MRPIKQVKTSDFKIVKSNLIGFTEGLADFCEDSWPTNQNLQNQND